ncbi:MAG: hypothetical protein H6Q49_1261 [Deltaproteobacteria bacterium]|nr:hypothetical protein [Deltaproteobacteria bacterium]
MRVNSNLVLCSKNSYFFINDNDNYTYLSIGKTSLLCQAEIQGNTGFDLSTDS